MRKRITNFFYEKLGFLFMVSLISIVPCLAQTSHHIVPSIVQKAMNDPQAQQWVDSVMRTLPPDKQLTQLFIYKVEPKKDPASLNLLSKVVNEYKVGGLLFSGGDMHTQAEVTNKAQKMSTIPLMITFDGEWGLAMRLKKTPRFPKNGYLEHIKNNQLLFDYGREVARELKEIGVQVNFAPDADVNSNPKNPIIGIRSFGRDPKNVASKVVAYSKGLESGNVLSVAKHFPGHGDSKSDSHKQLPLLDLSRERLDSVELVPFKAYINAHLGGIMVGHLEIPILEPRKKMPSSLSRNVSTYLLKDELGFDGLVFTDALDMGGVNIQGKCLKALQAGADLLLVPRILRSEYELIVQAMNNGALSKALIEKKCRKVLLYKYALGLYKKPYIKIPRLEQRINTPESKKLIERIRKTIETNKSQKEKLQQVKKGINSVAWTGIDSMIQDAVLQHAFPGCQLLIVKDGVALYDKNWGNYTYKRDKKVTSSTMYDLASMTKASATLLGIMKLYDQGNINLSDYASKFVPWLKTKNTAKITIKELLFHESGLPATVSVSNILINPDSYDGDLYSRYRNSEHPTRIWSHQYIRKQYGFYPNYLSDHQSKKFPLQITEKLWASTSVRDSIFHHIAEKPLYSRKYRYSDLNFILLQQVVEAITQEPMNQFLQKQFYGPMNLEETCFNPSTKFPTDLIAPTAYDAVIRGEILQGYVHDELAAFMGGVSGNAGLFSTAHDQARIYQMLINRGTLDSKRYLSENTVNLFIKIRSKKSRRGLGFDRPEPVYNKRGPLPRNAPRSMFGHLGFTGTCAWADPDNHLIFIFLSNRIYKNVWNPKLSELNIRDKIEEIVYDNIKG